MAANLPRLRSDPGSKVKTQETTFALDAVARFVCNTWDEVEAQRAAGGRPFDAVVVGSGMYGAYAATHLFRGGADAGLRTLVLEAGPFLLTEHIQNLSRLGFGVGDAVREVHWSSNIDQERAAGTRSDSYASHHVCVGGKSLFWGGWSPQLTAADLGRWPAPVRAYLQQIYPTIETQIGVAPGTDFLSGALNDRLQATVTAALPLAGLTRCTIAPIAVQGAPPAPGLFSFDKYSSLPLLIDAIREDAGRPDSERRLFLVPRCRVVHLPTARGAVRQIVAWVDGRIRTLDVSPDCAVILAATTMNSTRFALTSFPTTLSAAQERMGRNLMAHLRGNFTVRVRRGALGLAAGTPLQVGAAHVEGATADGRFHLQVYAAANVNPSAEEHLYRMIPHLEDLERVLASQNADWIVVTVRTVGEMAGARGAPLRAPDTSWMDLSPFARDVFGDFSTPSAHVHLAAAAADERLWTAMDDAAFALVLALAGGNAADIEYFYDGEWRTTRPADPRFYRDGLGTTFHECGTLWMGEDPDASVTDVYGQFHHVANAYCADQSLFPTSGSANPVPTGLALARRVADRVLAGHRGASPPAAPSGPGEAGFRRLFDGDLTPWRMAGTGQFVVVDGDTLETSGGPGILWYEPEEFDDFELRLDWRTLDYEDNSGVYLRIPRPTGADDLRRADAEGYEVQIDPKGADDPSGRFGQSRYKTGAVYTLAPATQGAARRTGRWNAFAIRASGGDITVALNGELVCELVGGGRRTRGHVGLQNHDQGSRVQFRNIRIGA